MVNQIKNSFGKKDHCVFEIPTPEFGILDETNKCCRIELNHQTEKFHFKVCNNGGGVVGFVPIDKCIYSDKDQFKKCDFVVFKKPHFCFVEIKDSEKRGGKRIPCAIEQLATTIGMFKAELDFNGFNLEAFICFQTKPVAIEASFLTTMFVFERDNGAKLFDLNEKKFG